MSDTSAEKYIGSTIIDFEVLAQETDRIGRWVGVEMAVTAKPIGHFLLRVVTKDQFAHEFLEETLDTDTAKLEQLVYGSNDNKPEEKLPFVLNDEIITEDILNRKFMNRVVEEDLAKSMWFADI